MKDVKLDWTDLSAARSVGVTILNVWVLVLVYAVLKLAWFLKARAAQAGKNLTVAQQITPSGLGDVYDMVVERQTRRRVGLVIFLPLIVTLAGQHAITLTAGFIARRAITSQTVIKSRDVVGNLVTDHHDSVTTVSNDIVATVKTLRAANFPLGELLDFAPNETRWQYSPDQWNATWKGSCELHNVSTVNTEIYLDGPDGTDFPNGVRDFGIGTLDDYAVGSKFHGSFRNYVWLHRTAVYVIRKNDTSQTSYSSVYHNSAPFNVRYLFVLARNVPMPRVQGDIVNMTVPVTFSWAECNYNRTVGNTRPDNVDYLSEAYPWVADTNAWASEVADPFHRNMTVAAFRQSPSFPVIDAIDLVQYSQAYLLVKDTQYLQPVTRTLDFQTDIVVVNLAIILIILFTLMIAAIIILYIFIKGRNNTDLKDLPFSKVDWALRFYERTHGQAMQPYGQLDRPESVVMAMAMAMEEQHAQDPYKADQVERQSHLPLPGALPYYHRVSSNAL